MYIHASLGCKLSNSVVTAVSLVVPFIQVKPTWRLAEQLVTANIQSAMVTDSSATTRAMSTDAQSPSEISSLFDTIAYGKCK